MKNKHFALLAGVLTLLAACDRNTVVEEPLAVPTRLEVNFVPSYGDADTKAVKQAWESGDKVFVFFEGVSGGYLILQYDGSDWASHLMYITPAHLDASGKRLTAVYLPFDNDAAPVFVNDRWSFDKTSLSYYFASQSHSYTVDTEGDVATLSLTDGSLRMTIPDGFVQFFIKDSEAVNAGASLRVSGVKPVRFDAVTLNCESGYYSPIPEGAAMPGYAYGEGDQKGYLFSGCLNADKAGHAETFQFQFVSGLQRKTASSTGILQHSGTAGRAANITGLSWSDDPLSCVPMWEDAEGYKYYLADMNLGAGSITDYGDYYAWGELVGYRPTGEDFGHTFGWPTYRWSNDDGSAFSKYNDVDGKTVLDAEDDAAAMWIGGGWHIPTRAEWNALTKNCTPSWVADYNESGVSGYIYTGQGSCSESKIFLPAAANASGAKLGNANYYVYYWSSTLSDVSFDTAYHIYENGGLNGKCLITQLLTRFAGTPIRPILKIK